MIGILIILTLLLALGTLATWYGYDSREGIHSQEEKSSAYGMTWGDPTDERLAQELAHQLRVAREQRLAGRLADQPQMAQQWGMGQIERQISVPNVVH